MQEFWKAIASIQEKLMLFYENIQDIMNTLTTLRYDINRNNRVLKELRAVCVEMSETETDKNISNLEVNEPILGRAKYNSESLF